MKTCSRCGATYTDRIDFCFEDGSVLTVHEVAAIAAPGTVDPPPPGPLGDVADAPMPGRLRTPPPAPRHEPVPAANTAPLAEADAPPADAPPTEAPEPEAEAPWLEPPPPVERRTSPPADDFPSAPDAPHDVTVPRQRPVPPPTLVPEGIGDDVTRPIPRPVSDDAEPAPRAERPAWLVPALAGGAGLLVLGAILGVVGLGLGGVALSGGNDGSASVAKADATPRAAATPPVEPAPNETVAAVAATPPDAPPPAAEEPAVAEAEPPPEPEPDPTPPATTAAAAVAAPPTATKSPPRATARETTPPPPAVSQGTVTITTSPPGARVSIDGEARGTAPVTVQLPYGTYIIEASADGHQNRRVTLDVKSASARQELVLEKKITSGVVIVLLQGRDGDTLLIDDKPVGTLPGRATLTEGKHRFAVEGASGRFEVTREVRFEGGTMVIDLAD